MIGGGYITRKYYFLAACGILGIIGFSLIRQYKIEVPLILNGHNKIPIGYQTIPPISHPIAKTNTTGTTIPHIKGGSILDRFTYRQSDWYHAAMEIYKDWEFKPRDVGCKNIRHVGNWPVCFDGVYNISPERPCLIYSFGIAFDFSFDDAMRKLGCEVHSFDPSMKTQDHVRKNGVIFHNMGLSDHDDDHFSPRKDSYVKDDQKWKIHKLKTILKQLRHINRTIDVLKIDVEGHEWEVVKNIMDDGLFSNVKQFMLEWHLFPNSPKRSDFRKCQQLYSSFLDSGFPKYFTNIHPKKLTDKQFNIQADTSHINRNFTTLIIPKS